MTPAHAAPLAPLPLARLTIPGRIRQIWGGKFDDRAARPRAPRASLARLPRRPPAG